MPNHFLLLLTVSVACGTAEQAVSTEEQKRTTPAEASAPKIEEPARAPAFESKHETHAYDTDGMRALDFLITVEVSEDAMYDKSFRVTGEDYSIVGKAPPGRIVVIANTEEPAFLP